MSRYGSYGCFRRSAPGWPESKRQSWEPTRASLVPTRLDNRIKEEQSMSTSGIAVFDKTLQTTNIWLDDIMRDLGPDRQLAWHVLGVVLRAMRDRLSADLAANLSSQ